MNELERFLYELDLAVEFARENDSTGVDRYAALTDVAQALRNALGAASTSSATLREPGMTDAQIKYMVDRFLGWRLPEHFHPDEGISFKPEYNVEYNAKRGFPPERHKPIGTNLFDVTQAEAMVRYMIDGLPKR